MVPLAILGAVVADRLVAVDLAEVARVNGVAIDRAALRDRVALEAFIVEQTGARIREGIARGQIDQATAATLTAALSPAADAVDEARSELVQDTLVTQLAAARGLRVRGIDPWSTLAGWIDAGLDREVAWLAVDPSAGAPGAGAGSADPSAAATAALAAGTPVATIVTQLQAAGWTASGGTAWLPADGPAPGVPDRIVDAARSGGVGDRLGPFPDRLGGSVVGTLLVAGPIDRSAAPALAAAAAAEGVRGDAVTAWATALSTRQALEATLITGWTTTPTEQVRGAEIVVGPSAVSGTEGPWLELAALRVMTPDAIAIRDRLLAVPWPARAAAFAGAATAADSAGGSGEMGYLDQPELAPAVWRAATASDVADGAIIGPETVAGVSYLYLVEARYGGALDERSAAALAEARASTDDPAALTARFDPPALPLATDSGWFAQPEYPTGDPVAAALFATPIGTRSDPVDLLGDLALFVPAAQRTAVPDADEAARIQVEAFGRWLAAQQAAATVVLDPDPLPELEPSATPTIPVLSPPALPTPVLPPTLPGLPGPPGPPATPGL